MGQKTRMPQRKDLTPLGALVRHFFCHLGLKLDVCPCSDSVACPQLMKCEALIQRFCFWPLMVLIGSNEFF